MARPGGILPPNAMHVDLGAIRHNVRTVRTQVGDGVTLLAAVKANAYGFGVFTVARVMLEAGVDGFALANVGDAIALRDSGIREPILLYGGTRPGTVIEEVARNDLMITVLDEADIQAAGSVGTRIRALVEMDVGLERLGATPSEALGLAREVHRHATIELAGMYTHMHVPKGPIDAIGAYVAWEFQRFTAVVSALEAEGIPIPIKLAASSGALRLTDTMSLNAVDVGSLIYGLEPPGPMNRSMDLRPALRSVTSRLTQAKPVDRREHVALSPIPGGVVRLGVIPMGSSDGLIGFSVGHVLVRGRRAPVLGISLEHTRLDLSGIDDAEAGDEVVIIGRQGDEEISIRDVARTHDLPTPAAVPVVVGGRIERRYVDEGPGDAQGKAGTG